MTDSSVPADVGALAARTPVGEQFFGWIRSTGLVRQSGWIGGVCGAIGARTGLDPTLVRGLFVVAAALALPSLFAYGLLWMLLPDEDDVIEAERMVNGRFEPPLVAALVLTALGLVPVVPWIVDLAFDPGVFGYSGYVYTIAYWLTALSKLAFLVLGSAVVALLVRAWVVRLRRVRKERQSSVATRAVQPTLAAPPAFDPTLPGAPGAQPTGSRLDGDAFALWRRQHEAWLAQHEAWRDAQADVGRTARERLAVDRSRAEADRVAAAAARRLISPRVGVGFVVLVFGVAAAFAAATAIMLAPSGPAVSTAGALFAAALVGGVGMVVAGILRRRSGVFAALTVVALVGAVGASLLAVPLGLVPGRETKTGVLSPLNDSVALGDGEYAQLRGITWINPVPGKTEGKLTVSKGRGNTYLIVPVGAIVDLTATLGYGDLVIWESVGDGSMTTRRLSPIADSPGADRDADGAQEFSTTLYGEASTVPAEPSAPRGHFTVDVNQLVGDVYVQFESSGGEE